MGAKKGDAVQVTTPSGRKIEYKIIKITR